MLRMIRFVLGITSMAPVIAMQLEVFLLTDYAAHEPLRFGHYKHGARQCFALTYLFYFF